MKQLDRETRLWNYIDGKSDALEMVQIRQLITENKDWQQAYEELSRIHQMAGTTELEQPSVRFTKNVMEEIAKFQIAPATKQYINKWIIWGIVIFFLILAGSLLVFGSIHADWSTVETSSGWMGLASWKVYLVPLLNPALINLFILVNIILGWILLDHYLSHQKHFPEKSLNT